MTYTKKTLSQIKDAVILNIVTNVEGINDANVGSVLDIFTTALSQELEEIYDDLDVVYNSTKISTATTTDLEELGLLVGVERSSGTMSTGSVTFIRNAITTTDFIIPANTIISTQPNTDTTITNFITTSDDTFYSEIPTEEHTYITGTTDYDFDERLVDSITSINGTLSSAAHTFVATTDYVLITTGDRQQIQWTGSGDVPDNNTSFHVTYKPLSLDVACTAQEVGVDGNVSIGKILYMSTFLTNVDRIYNYEAFINGTDIESDLDYRVRIQNATSLANVATVDAIKFHVLAMDSINDVYIDNTPFVAVNAETFVYTTGIDKYVLKGYNAIDNSSLKVGNSSGAADYTKDTDYQLTKYNEIEWLGVSNPTTGSTIYVDYDYNKSGLFDVYALNTEGELTDYNKLEIVEKVDTVISAGITYNVYEPTVVSINVTVTLLIDTDNYDSTVVKSAVSDIITTYFSSLKIGDDVYQSTIITNIVGVDGVLNVTINDIGGGGASDYTIDFDEIATEGTITVN